MGDQVVDQRHEARTGIAQGLDWRRLLERFMGHEKEYAAGALAYPLDQRGAARAAGKAGIKHQSQTAGMGMCRAMGLPLGQAASQSVQQRQGYMARHHGNTAKGRARRKGAAIITGLPPMPGIGEFHPVDPRGISPPCR